MATLQINGQTQGSAKRVSRYLLGIGVLFMLSAVLFCPITQAAVTNLVLPLYSGLHISFETVTHLAFLSLLVIGLRM